MGTKQGCGSEDGGIDMIVTDEWMEEEVLADKMQNRLFILKMIAALHPGMTVVEYNQTFGRLTESRMLDYIHLMRAARKQLRGEA